MSDLTTDVYDHIISTFKDDDESIYLSIFAIIV